MDDREDYSVDPLNQQQPSQDPIALLRSKLCSVFGADVSLTRETALQLLQIISETLGPSLRVQVDETGCGDVFVTEHPGIDLLNELRDAIADLENAKTHAALSPANHGANASRSTKLAKSDHAYLELVEVIQAMEGFKTRKAAEELVARMFQSTGTTRKGKAINAGTLKSMRDRSRTKR